MPAAALAVAAHRVGRAERRLPARLRRGPQRRGRAGALARGDLRGRLRVRLGRAGRHLERHDVRLRPGVARVAAQRVRQRRRAACLRPGAGGRAAGAALEGADRRRQQVRRAGRGRGRIFVGTRDGHVLGFGAPVGAPVSGQPVTFPATTVGQTATQTLTLTASAPVTVSALRSSRPEFTLGTPSRALPATLASGDSLSVPVTFAPAAAGTVAGAVTASTDRGDADVAVSGTGRANVPELTPSTRGVSFGATPPGGHLAQAVTLTNTGSS